jgi:hypothetical protein
MNAAILRAVRSVSLDASAIEVVLTVDGAPLHAVRAPANASIEWLARVNQPGEVQAFVLGDFERWKQTLDDKDRDKFITLDPMNDILARAEKLFEELTRVDVDLDKPPAPRRDYRSVLVAATPKTGNGELLTPAKLQQALANAPILQTKNAAIPSYDEEAAIDAPSPAIAEQWIALIPAGSAHEALAHLRFGGFNACPATAVHVAVMRRWEAAFGASLVLVAPDELVVHVARPPAKARDIHIALLEQGWLGGDERPSLGETKGHLWRWWWD